MLRGGTGGLGFFLVVVEVQRHHWLSVGACPSTVLGQACHPITRHSIAPRCGVGEIDAGVCSCCYCPSILQLVDMKQSSLTGSPQVVSRDVSIQMLQVRVHQGRVLEAVQVKVTVLAAIVVFVRQVGSGM